MNTERQAFLEEFKDFRVDVPDGSHGLWEVRRKEMTERDSEVYNIMEEVLKTDRHTWPGTFTQLVRYGDAEGNPYTENIVMTDHECEVADHAALVNYARSRGRLQHVLINGLGLGVAIKLLEPYVEHFTIVELSKSVIRLVEPHYKKQLGARLFVINADALTFKPPSDAHYDAVFHDIWDNITHENLPDMRRLHRKYGRLCDWQASWAREYCDRQAKKRRRNPDAYKNEVTMEEALNTINTTLHVSQGATQS